MHLVRRGSGAGGITARLACGGLCAAIVVGCAAGPRTPAAALARYAELTRRTDAAGLAAMYSADGRLERDGAAPLVGPDAVRGFLAQFRDVAVLEDRMTVERESVSGPHAVQAGRYFQRVRLPDTRVVEATGRFEAEWVRIGGDWRVARMRAVPDRP